MSKQSQLAENVWRGDNVWRSLLFFPQGFPVYHLKCAAGDCPKLMSLATTAVKAIQVE